MVRGREPLPLEARHPRAHTMRVNGCMYALLKREPDVELLAEMLDIDAVAATLWAHEVLGR